MAGPNQRKPLKILILGGGIAGLTTALALTKFSPPNLSPTIQVYEVRPKPATIGGAVNLTPNALRLLSHLGALQEIRAAGYGKEIRAVEVFDMYGGKLAESQFVGEGEEGAKGLGNPPFMGLRITRGDSLKGVLATIEKQPNISLTCGKKTVSVREDDQGVNLTFEDGEIVSGDVLIGCDGIHSVTRLKHVEPGRTSIYSGICNAFGFAPRRDIKTSSGSGFEDVHFTSTAINFARKGMLLTSFHTEACDAVYVGALMQVPAIESRDGWKAAGTDADKIRKDMLDRFGGGPREELIDHLINDAEDLFLWPVFTLSKGGKWATERTMLIGDSAHAMPPQGESTGIVFEDAVLFSRCLCRWMEKYPEGEKPIKEAFDAYERLRRERIDIAFEESKSVVKAVSDAGWLGHKIKTFVIPWYLWWTRAYREKHFVEDVTTSELGY